MSKASISKRCAKRRRRRALAPASCSSCKPGRALVAHVSDAFQDRDAVMFQLASEPAPFRGAAGPGALQAVGCGRRCLVQAVCLSCLLVWTSAMLCSFNERGKVRAVSDRNLTPPPLSVAMYTNAACGNADGCGCSTASRASSISACCLGVDCNGEW